MGRSTKTKHVMNLVGAEPVKRPAPPPKPEERDEIIPPVLKILEPEIISEPEIAEQEETAPAEPVEAVQEEPPAAHEDEEQEPEPPVYKPKITAIVCELINQELGSVAERFHLNLTDSNLWELTRAALQEVRPEFSADIEETEEKLERLRPQVIGAMAKTAIKLSAKDRK